MPDESQTNMTRTVRFRPAGISALGALSTLLLLAAQGNAQDALGNGQALDANSGQYGSGNYQQPSLVDELRFRNAIATGNAPGGLSFRGDIGYRSSGEFTGALGSDSLFAFRRDSLYSGLAGMGIRGTDAIQYQFALTTGSAPPRNLMGSLSYSRDDVYSSSSALPRPGSTQRSTIGFDPEQTELDPTGRSLSTPPTITGLDSGSMMGTLRSSSTYNTTSTFQPSLLSVYTEGVDNRPVGLVASPLLGITPTPLVDAREPIVNPLVARPGNADTDPSVPGGLPSTRITTSYDELVQQMRDRAEAIREAATEKGKQSPMMPGETNDQWLIRQMDEIRRSLYGDPNQNMTDPGQNQGENSDGPIDPATNLPIDQSGNQGGDQTGDQTDNGAATLPPLVSIPDATDSPLSERVNEALEQLNATSNTPIEGYDPTEIAIDPDTLEVLRGNAANEVTQLLDPNAESRDLYSEHILAGQRLIADGRYFDAEERFTHALSIKPGDVSAQLGRLHAQIGAGMLLSASVNIQSLFSDHPELIASKYSAGVLPSPARVDALKQQLSERAGIVKPSIRTRGLEGDRVRVSAGLLTAYLGYQSNDAGAISSGLEIVRTLGTDSDRRFASLLKQLWVVAEEPVTTP